MVFGQHRFSSYPSPEPGDPELSSGEMPSLRTAVSIGETGHAPFKPQVTHISPLGRTLSKARWLPGGKNFAESTQSKGANNKEISSSLIWLTGWAIQSLLIALRIRLTPKSLG